MDDAVEVQYTESLVIKNDSSLVEGIFYNANDKTVTFDLQDRIYRYAGVSREDALKVANATNAGGEYQLFKRKFGPGESLGDYEDISWKRVETAANIKADSISPALISSDKFSGAVTGLNLALQSPPGHNDNGQWELNKTPAEYSKFRVGFVVVDQTEWTGSVSELKYHNLVGTSIEDAKAKVQELGSILNLEFRVKEVTVYFD